MQTARQIPQYLGLQKSIVIRNDLDIIILVRGRLSKRNFNFVRKELKITLKEFSALLKISEKTIQRYKETELLNETVSEGLVEIAEIIAMGVEVLGNKAELLDWLHSPIVALGGNEPITFLDTHHGRKLLMIELGRIEHGVYA